mmetsp:Transcript_36737/g.105934  ORF Transcript_36737/g.105934 Transcript_36737/m.105934 type:complete len:329 (+) Transcript_36737:345-1331(+)
MHFTMYFLRLTMSLTLAWFLPRSCNTASINEPNVMVSICCLSSTSSSLFCSLKMKSSDSNRPTTSTPSSWIAFAVVGVQMSIWKSSLESTVHSPAALSGKRSLRATISRRRTSFTMFSSCSTSDTTSTTWTMTPTSKLSTVNDAMKTYIMSNSVNMKFSAEASSISGAKSGKVAWTNKLNMHVVRESKYFSPRAVSRERVLNATLNKKTTIIRRVMVKNTERPAEYKPLIKTISSGKALIKRATRAMRKMRMSLKSRRIEVFFMELPPVLFVAHMIVDITQMSPTDMTTRKESKTKGLSQKALTFFSKAPKRMSHSAAKVKQNKCSMT